VGAPSFVSRPELLVLDGQQRLSSLISALTPLTSFSRTPASSWFLVNLDVRLSEPDSGELVFDRAKSYGALIRESLYEQRMLPCTYS
jgi:hypothetical protein